MWAHRMDGFLKIIIIIVVVCYFEVGSHYVSLTYLEFTM